MRRVWWCLWLLACATDPTQLVVVVDSNLSGAEMDAVEVVVRGLEGGEQRAVASLADGSLPRFVGIERRGGSLGPIEIEARAMLGGSPTITQVRRTSFVAGETRRVDLYLAAACRGVTCPDETCERGTCESVDVSPDALLPWEGLGSNDGGMRGDAGVDASVDAGRFDSGVLDASRDADSATPSCVEPDVAGLVLHLDARDATPGVWPDRSGFGRTGTLNTVTVLPDAFGAGLPAVVTRADAKSFVSFDNPVLGATDVSFFLVLRTDDTSQSGNARHRPCVLGGFVEGGAEPSLALVANRGTIGLSVAQSNGYGPAVVAAGSIADSLPHLISGARYGGGTQGAIRVDSVLLGTGDLRAGVLGLPERWRLGAHDDEDRGRFGAQYAEVRIYDRALSAAELEEVEAYLRCTWFP